MEYSKLESLLNSDKEKFTVELDKEQIAILTVSLYSDIEEYREVKDNLHLLDENEKEGLTENDIEEMITDRKILIENIVNTHYPIFEWVISE